MNESIIYQPQKGPQMQLMECHADIAIMGGAAGVGKTFSLVLLNGTFALQAPDLNIAVFRRTVSDLIKPGAIWDEATNMYPNLGAKANNADHFFRFQNKSKIMFSGMQYEQDKFAWQGAQLDIASFDELTHFTETQFWYIIGRLRSVSGNIKPFCRATCNPALGWVRDLVDWWIDDDGFPIKERSGVIRWFCRLSGKMHWFDTKEEAEKYISEEGIDATKIMPMSFTFISGTINDNHILMKNNPRYYANLAQLPEAEKQQLLHGNWNIMPTGTIFDIETFKYFAVEPSDIDCKIITCDTANKTGQHNDYTVFQVWGRSNKNIYLLDQVRGKYNYSMQKRMLVSLIIKHSPHKVLIEQAASGFMLIEEVPKETPCSVIPITRDKDKYTRAYEAEPYVSGGYVYINPQASYFTEFVSEFSNFDPSQSKRSKNADGSRCHDDQVDPTVDAIYHLLRRNLWRPPEIKQKVYRREPQNAIFRSYKHERPTQHSHRILE